MGVMLLATIVFLGFCDFESSTHPSKAVPAHSEARRDAPSAPQYMPNAIGRAVDPPSQANYIQDQSSFSNPTTTPTTHLATPGDTDQQTLWQKLAQSVKDITNSAWSSQGKHPGSLDERRRYRKKLIKQRRREERKRYIIPMLPFSSLQRQQQPSEV